MLTWSLNLKHMNPHAHRPTMQVAMRPFAGAVHILQTRISCAIQHLNSHVCINCKSELRRMIPCRSSSTMLRNPLVRVFITTNRGGRSRLKYGRRNFWEPHVSLCATAVLVWPLSCGQVSWRWRGSRAGRAVYCETGTVLFVAFFANMPFAFRLPRSWCGVSSPTRLPYRTKTYLQKCA